MTASAAAPHPRSLGADAQLIGLVGLAHAISHFSQLILPPLFPWIKDAFSLTYTELGAVLTVFKERVGVTPAQYRASFQRADPS